MSMKLMDYWISFLILLALFNASECTDSRETKTSHWPFAFCLNADYRGKGSCNAKEDRDLENKFESFRVADKECGMFLKQILCMECHQLSSHLFQDKAQSPYHIPALCNSTDNSANENNKKSYCSKFWNACKNIAIWGAPFLPSYQVAKNKFLTNTSYRLGELWESEENFCNVFGGSIENGASCLNGLEVVHKNDNNETTTKENLCITSKNSTKDGVVCQKVTPRILQETEDNTSVEGICLERIGNSSFINMVPHPDGTNRALFGNQKGVAWLGTLPEIGSGKLIEFDMSAPFLNLSGQILSDGEYGLVGLAFHPEFKENGRFFASFNCRTGNYPNCKGRCGCNTAVKCDPRKLASQFKSEPCNDYSVIAEFKVDGTEPFKAEFVKPVEERRIFTMGLPFSNHHGGQILFGPEDGYLYFMMGDGGYGGDPYNFAQNEGSLLGKIMRININNPSEAEINELALWGNYSIPSENPYVKDKNWRPEIWASGFRNPWRCSFDSLNSSKLFCADVGQETYEEVDLVVKGGNYGWRNYEGIEKYSPSLSLGGNTSSASINYISPILGYYHSEINKGGAASITGGYVSRSAEDPCLYGRYVYADLFGSDLWVATERPVGSGNYNSTKVIFKCSLESPIPCSYSNETNELDIGMVFSFGQDNNNNLYLLTGTGIYRTINPRNCSIKCSKTSIPGVSSPPTVPEQPPSSISNINKLQAWSIIFLVSLCIIL